MEDVNVLVFIVSGMLPIVLALIKKIQPLSTLPSYTVAFGLSLIVSMVYNASRNAWDIKVVLSDLATVFAVSQAVYAVLKSNGTIDKIEK